MQPGPEPQPKKFVYLEGEVDVIYPEGYDPEETSNGLSDVPDEPDPGELRGLLDDPNLSTSGEEEFHLPPERAPRK